MAESLIHWVNDSICMETGCYNDVGAFGDIYCFDHRCEECSRFWPKSTICGLCYVTDGRMSQNNYWYHLPPEIRVMILNYAYKMEIRASNTRSRFFDIEEESSEEEYSEEESSEEESGE